MSKGPRVASLLPLVQVFSRKEMELIAELCVRHDVLCFSDEVYEWLVYDGNKHIRMGKADPFFGHLASYLILPLVCEPELV